MDSKDILMIRARLFRVEDDAVGEPTALRLRGAKILALGPAALVADAPTEVVDLEERCVLPGLIDGHVHLELDPTLATPAEQLALGEAERALAMRARVRAMLGFGITTARDCGGGAWREHGVRDEIERGVLAGPRLLCCGQPVTTPNGHCAFWGGTASAAPGELERVVARQVEAGSDWIKVIATGGVFTPGSRVRDLQYDADSLARVVSAAARAGRSVAAHCHGKAGIAAALAAGIRTIEHASFAGPDGFGTDLDDALIEAIAANPVWVSPTVNANWYRRRQDDAGRPSDFFRRMSNCLGRQRAAGVRMIASSDAGIPGVFHHALALGLEALECYAGMKPVEVLRAATTEAARALGLADVTGRIEPGLAADLVVVDGDPTRDLRALRDPRAVVARGSWFGRERLLELRAGILPG